MEKEVIVMSIIFVSINTKLSAMTMKMFCFEDFESLRSIYYKDLGL